MTVSRVPKGPTELSGRSWWGVLRRTVREFNQDDLSDWAAALTYRAMMSIFPTLVVLIAVLGLLGPSATQAVTNTITQLISGQGGPAGQRRQGTSVRGANRLPTWAGRRRWLRCSLEP